MNRAAKLQELDAECKRDQQKLDNSTHLAEEYKAKLRRQLHDAYTQARSTEEQRIRDEIESERRRHYSKIHKKENRTASLEEEVRLSNIRAELMSELEGGANVTQLYEQAIKVGDHTRGRLLASIGPSYIKNTAERIRFRNLVYENEDAATKRARQKLAEVERESMVLDTASAIQKGLNRRRERRLTKPVSSATRGEGGE
jgi:hypothetical protein